MLNAFDLPEGLLMQVYLQKEGDNFSLFNPELYDGLKDGFYEANLKKKRNSFFHRKFFALLNVAYQAWDCEKEFKDFESFREDIIILAGYYTTVFNLDGTFKLKPKSISFGKMDEIQFSALYSKVIDVILGKVLTNYKREDLEKQVEMILGFA